MNRDPFETGVEIAFWLTWAGTVAVVLTGLFIAVRTA